MKKLRFLLILYLLAPLLSYSQSQKLDSLFQVLEKTRTDSAQLFDTHLDIGDLYRKQGNIQQAIAHFDSAEMFMANNKVRQAYELNKVLGNFFWAQNKYEEAKRYYLTNRYYARQMEDSLIQHFATANLGLLYNNLQEPDSAIYLLEMALPHIQKADPDWAACIHGCLGTNYKDLGDCKTALHHYNTSLNASGHLEESWECATFAEMATCYLSLGDLAKAEYYNDLAIRLLDQSTNLKLKRDAFEELVDNYKMRGDYKRAFLNLESLKVLEDTLFKIENKKATAELLVKYQSKEQQALLEVQDFQLNRQRILIALATLLLSLLAIILFLIWRNALHRKRTNALLAERNKQLENLDRSKSRFFANISHELRTPLTLVTAPLEQAIEKVKDKAVKKNIQVAHRNSQKLLVLVDEILDLSKLESGQMQLHFSDIQLEEVLRRIFFAFQSLADIRRLKLAFNNQLPEDLWVRADFPKLEKILNNLISNAVKYSKPGGLVKLAARIDTTLNKENILIEVIDIGKGIHQDDLPKIFERFYQSQSDLLIGGTGIGLALSKELVHLMKGNLTVKSKEGKGSTFSLLLPMKQIAKPQTGKRQATGLLFEKEDKVGSISYSPILLDGQKPKILIVEDNLEMSRFLKQALASHYECAIAYDGTEALQQLERTHFDLVTSDVMMPQMDGFEFLEKVRQGLTVFKNIPFILLTARSLEADKLAGFQLGVDDYITKPFSVKELMARIRNLLKNKQSRDDWKTVDKEDRGESADRKSLKLAEQIVINHIGDSNFGVQQLSAALALSQRSLVRLIKRLTGLSPVGFIREIRLQKAYTLLQRRQFSTITEVRHEVGIENASYFNRIFKERFGINPKKIMGEVGI